MRVRTMNWDAVLASRPANASAARDLSVAYTRDPAAETPAPLPLAEVPTVRFAERADFGELMDLCQQLHAEDGLFSLALDRVEVMLLKHFEREGGLIGVIGGPDRLEGAIALHMTRMWYSDEWLLEEIFSYVRPEYRRSSNAKNLLHFGKSCAEKIGVPLLASVVSSAHTEGKRGLYDRAFGPALGSFYIENRPANV